MISTLWFIWRFRRFSLLFVSLISLQSFISHMFGCHHAKQRHHPLPLFWDNPHDCSQLKTKTCPSYLLSPEHSLHRYSATYLSTQLHLWPFSPGKAFVFRSVNYVDVFLWDTESCCVINLPLCCRCFFVWEDKKPDVVVTVDLSQFYQCSTVPAPVLLHKVFMPCIVWRYKDVIGLYGVFRAEVSMLTDLSSNNWIDLVLMTLSTNVTLCQSFCALTSIYVYLFIHISLLICIYFFY